MTNDKMNEVLRGYLSKELEYVEPLRADLSKPITEPIRHARWMTEEALNWPAERLAKKFRWLGFIQGILCMLGILTIDEAKNANKPDGESPKKNALQLDREIGDHIRAASKILATYNEGDVRVLADIAGEAPESLETSISCSMLHAAAEAISMKGQ